MKKVLVFGANSYIARNLIHIIKNRKDLYLYLYDYQTQHLDNCDNYKCINILDPNEISKVNLECDIIYWFAGKTGTSNGFDEYDTFIDVNEKALLNLLKEYRNQCSKAKIIYPSTRLIYKGKPGKLHENSEKEFKTIYAINKYSCEQYLNQYHLVYGIQYCIFRICVPYGSLIPNASSYGTAEFMISCAQRGNNISLYGDGTLRRTITYIGDLCKVLICGAENEECINDVYNIGGEDYSLKEMADLISAKYGVSVDYVLWPEIALKIESGNTVFDDKKLSDIIGDLVSSKFTDWIDNK